VNEKKKKKLKKSILNYFLAIFYTILKSFNFEKFSQTRLLYPPAQNLGKFAPVKKDPEATVPINIYNIHDIQHLQY